MFKGHEILDLIGLRWLFWLSYHSNLWLVAAQENTAGRRRSGAALAAALRRSLYNNDWPPGRQAPALPMC